jgi:hypothetical protein
VLLFFTAQCQYCLRAVPAWRRLHESLSSQPGGPDVIWISLSSRDSTAEYVVEHGIRAESVAFPPDWKMERVMRARSVPVTVVLDHRGKVAFVRSAVLGSEAALDSVRTAAVGRSAPGAFVGGRPGRDST